MKIASVGIMVVGAMLQAACVTEGVIRAEPASDEEQAEVNLALGVGYLQEDRPDLAVDALLRAVEAEPRNANAHSVLAIAYDQTGSIELAEEHHRRASQLAPRDANVQNRHAVFLCRQNRWSEAEPSFRRAIDSTNNAAAITATINAASCARGSGDLASAERYFREALSADPVNVEALRGMVDISIRASNYLQARAFWQRLERGVSILAEDLYSCYVIERELNANDAADACADRLQREFPGSPVMNQLRSYVPDDR